MYPKSDRRHRTAESFKVFVKSKGERVLFSTILTIPYSINGLDSVKYKGKMYPVYWNGVDGSFITAYDRF